MSTVNMEFTELFIYFFIPQTFVTSCGSDTVVGAEP